MNRTSPSVSFYIGGSLKFTITAPADDISSKPPLNWASHEINMNSRLIYKLINYILKKKFRSLLSTLSNSKIFISKVTKNHT